MSSVESTDFRMQELAAGASLGDLTDAELHEINSYDTKTFQLMIERSEEAAARTFLTFQGVVPTESMPEELTARLKNMASGFFDELSKEKRGEELTQKVSTMGPSIAPSLMGLREITAWLCTAASVALALSIWLPGKNVRSLSALQQRDALIASAPDLVRSNWESTAIEKTTGIGLGGVVWSSDSQQGFMTIQGLPVNDPKMEQYQLWIIDPSRDKNPIDGGVFNIETKGESIVPIQAKLRVGKPTLFAITVEKPGGVVVSDQSKMPLLAKIAAQ